MEPRHHERLIGPGRRQSDRRPAIADRRRVLLVGPDDAWRRFTMLVFEEAGYAAYAAVDCRQAAAFTIRLLPDVVVVQMNAHDTLDALARLSETPSTCDIPVVVLTSSLASTEARRARAAGGVTLLPHLTDLNLLVDEVETLIAAAPRAQRTLRRRLLDLQDVARHYTRDAGGQATFRRLIDRLQVAMFAADAQGQCVAASQGATRLTGYSHGQLLSTSVFHADFAGGRMSDGRWRDFLVHRQYAGTTTIITRAGQDVTVYAAAAAEILPGFHVAAAVAAA